MKIWKYLSFLVLVSMMVTACAQATPAAPAATTAPAATEAATTAPAATEVAATTAPAATEAATTAPATPVSGGTMTWAITGDIPGFEPILNDNGDEIRIYSQFAEPLFYGGENYPSVWTPKLATGYERSADGLTWTIHLRPNVLWQDGTPFTADDVLFWAQAIQDKATTGAGWMHDRLYVDGKPFVFAKVDDLTVTITSAKPVPSLIGDICVPLIPKKYFTDNNIANADMVKSKFNTDAPIGTGAFQLTSYKKGEAAILTAFAQYWGGKPYLDSIVVRFIPEEAARVNALKTGEVDFERVDPQYAPDLAKNPSIKLMIKDVDMIDQFRFNVGKPMLADKRTRQALAYGLDRQAMLQAAYQGYAKVADSPFSAFVSAYEPLPNYDFSVDKASQLLQEVGWVKGSDGILTADNVTGVAKGTRFTLTIDLTSTDIVEKTSDVMAQSYWKALGIDVTLRQIDFNVWNDQNQNKEDKPFDVVFSGTGFLGANGLGYGWLMDSTKAGSGMSYVNPQIHDLFTQAKSLEDPAARDALLKQAAKLFWDDLPALNLYYSQRIWAYNARVHLEDAGFNSDMVGLFEFPQKIWVEK
jgi:peptide/nickel transport system substrate-binding protein